MTDGIQPDAAAPTLEPYYEDGAVTIYHGDSLELLESMTEVGVACTVTSPPYNTLGSRIPSTPPGRWRVTAGRPRCASAATPTT